MKMELQCKAWSAEDCSLKNKMLVWRICCYIGNVYLKNTPRNSQYDFLLCISEILHLRVSACSVLKNHYKIVEMIRLPITHVYILNLHITFMESEELLIIEPFCGETRDVKEPSWGIGGDF